MDCVEKEKRTNKGEGRGFVGLILSEEEEYTTNGVICACSP